MRLLPAMVADLSHLELFSVTYGFSPGIEGLCYIGLGLGFVLATIIGASVADKVYHAVRKKQTCSIDGLKF